MDPCRKSPGRPKDLKKQASIMKAALQHFMQHGFDRASMDAIAAAAGVSKLTIYSHFGCKESLFQAIVAQKCNQVRLADDYDKLLKLSAEAALMHIGRRFLDVIFQKDTIDMHRVLIAESVDRPKVSRLLYEAGPAKVKLVFSEFLHELTKRKKLKVDDPVTATNHFFTLLKGEQLDMMLFNLRGPMTKKEKEAHLKDCVRLFLRAYAA